ncbi:MAG: hypothetical protein HN337_03410 [Deltaproteobacteria bacterium]|jgi:hypothetical protein|nr:hypothetical protein [Deltaproteobacteria bacterium]
MRYQKISLIFISIMLVFTFSACSEEAFQAELENGTPTAAIVACDGCISQIHPSVELAGSIDASKLYQSELLQLFGIGAANELISEFTPFQNPETQIRSACFGAIFPDFEESSSNSTAAKSLKMTVKSSAVHAKSSLAAVSGMNSVSDGSDQTTPSDNSNNDDKDDDEFPPFPAVLVVEGDLGEGFNLNAFLSSKNPEGLEFVEDYAIIPIGEDGSESLYVGAASGKYVMATSKEFFDYARGISDESQDVCPQRAIWQKMMPTAAIKIVLAKNVPAISDVQAGLATAFTAVPSGIKGTYSLDFGDVVSGNRISMESKMYKGTLESEEYDDPFMESNFKLNVTALNLKLDDVTQWLAVNFKTVAEISECDGYDMDKLLGDSKFGGLDKAPECELISAFHDISYSDMDGLYEISSAQVQDYVNNGYLPEGIHGDIMKTIDKFGLSAQALAGLRSSLTSAEARCVRDYFRDHHDAASFCNEQTTQTYSNDYNDTTPQCYNEIMAILLNDLDLNEGQRELTAEKLCGGETPQGIILDEGYQVCYDRIYGILDSTEAYEVYELEQVAGALCSTDGVN